RWRRPRRWRGCGWWTSSGRSLRRICCHRKVACRLTQISIVLEFEDATTEAEWRLGNGHRPTTGVLRSCGSGCHRWAGGQPAAVDSSCEFGGGDAVPTMFRGLWAFGLGDVFGNSFGAAISDRDPNRSEEDGVVWGVLRNDGSLRGWGDRATTPLTSSVAVFAGPGRVPTHGPPRGADPCASLRIAARRRTHRARGAGQRSRLHRGRADLSGRGPGRFSVRGRLGGGEAAAHVTARGQGRRVRARAGGHPRDAQPQRTPR